MWTLDAALKLIREIQPKIKQFRYHAALGGGVINKGQSYKDLDLYLLPFGEQIGIDPDGLRAFLITVLGECYNLGGPSVLPADVLCAYPADSTWKNGRYTYWLGGPGNQRIDVFIA